MLEIVTTDPDIIKEVFISQFGNFVARKVRGIINFRAILMPLCISLHDSQFLWIKGKHQTDRVMFQKIAINMVYPLLDGLLQVDHEGTKGMF